MPNFSISSEPQKPQKAVESTGRASEGFKELIGKRIEEAETFVTQEDESVAAQAPTLAQAMGSNETRDNMATMNREDLLTRVVVLTGERGDATPQRRQAIEKILATAAQRYGELTGATLASFGLPAEENDPGVRRAMNGFLSAEMEFAAILHMIDGFSGSSPLRQLSQSADDLEDVQSRSSQATDAERPRAVRRLRLYNQQLIDRASALTRQNTETRERQRKEIPNRDAAVAGLERVIAHINTTLPNAPDAQRDALTQARRTIEEQIGAIRALPPQPPPEPPPVAAQTPPSAPTQPPVLPPSQSPPPVIVAPAAPPVEAPPPMQPAPPSPVELPPVQSPAPPIVPEPPMNVAPPPSVATGPSASVPANLERGQEAYRNAISTLEARISGADREIAQREADIGRMSFIQRGIARVNGVMRGMRQSITAVENNRIAMQAALDSLNADPSLVSNPAAIEILLKPTYVINFRDVNRSLRGPTWLGRAGRG